MAFGLQIRKSEEMLEVIGTVGLFLNSKEFVAL